MVYIIGNIINHLIVFYILQIKLYLDKLKIEVNIFFY